MKVRYTPHFFDDFGAVEYSPRLPVVFTNPRTKLEIRPLGLVDSGSAETLLNVRLVKLLGIEDVTSGEKALYGGVGGDVEGYRHILRLRVMGDRRTFETNCAFVPLGTDIDCLLGQRGFFENYKVVFEKYKNQFEVIAKRKG